MNDIVTKGKKKNKKKIDLKHNSSLCDSVPWYNARQTGKSL